MTFWPRISYVMSTHSGSGGLFPMRSRGRNDSANSSYAQCTKVSAVNFLVGAQVCSSRWMSTFIWRMRCFTLDFLRSHPLAVRFARTVHEPCAPRQCGPQVAGPQCWKIWSAATITQCRHLREFLSNGVLRLEGPLTHLTCIT